ncbi:MAG: histidine phosphatase family protein [Acidimicrobiales bacterium]
MTVAATADIAPRTRLVLIRHGEAVSNAEDTIAGHLTCKGLTEHGRQQVGALANRLRRTGELDGASALYSSVLVRAVQTAEMLSPVLGGLPVERRCSLCERHVGAAEGMKWKDYEDTYGVLKPSDHPYREMAPGGESWVGFLDRAEAGLRQVMAAHPGGLVVVAGHGGLIGTSMIRFLGLPEHGVRFGSYPDNSSITEWCWTGTRWWLVRFNDAAHLDDETWGATTGLRIPTPDWVSSSP